MLAPIAALIARATAERGQIEDGFNRQFHPLSVDENCAADQLVELSGLQRQEHSIERQERDEGERAESRGLKVEPGPEHGRVSERLEPKCVNVIRQRRAAAEYRNGHAREQGDKNAPPPRRLAIDDDVSTAVRVATHFVFSAPAFRFFLGLRGVCYIVGGRCGFGGFGGRGWLVGCGINHYDGGVFVGGGDGPSAGGGGVRGGLLN